jgi:Tfp pilus assembly protein PilN
MEGGINLLPQLTEKEIKAGVYRRKINLVALGSVGFIGLVIVALFSYQLFLTVRAGDIENRTQKASEQIRENRETEVLNRSLKQKVEQLQTILTTTIPTSILIKQITEAAAAVPEPLRLTGISMSGKNVVTVEGLAIGSQPSENLKAWVNNLTSANGKDYFANVELVSLTGNRIEGYKFNYKMSFLKKGIYQLRNED